MEDTYQDYPTNTYHVETHADNQVNPGYMSYQQEQQQQQQPQLAPVNLFQVQPPPKQSLMTSMDEALPVEVVNNYKTYLGWTICNAIVFLPHIYLWIPALVCSLVTRSKVYRNKFKSARRFSNATLTLNLLCLFVGLLAYVAAAVFIPLTLLKQFFGINII